MLRRLNQEANGNLVDEKRSHTPILCRFPRGRLGGIVTDLQSRALDANGQPIAGLYAIGESAGFGGGGSHGWRGLEGTFLLSSIITARRAAESVAR